MTSPAGDTVGTDLQTLRLAGRTVTAQVREAITDAALVRTVEGASTLELVVHDPDRVLLRSPLLSQRVTATVDRAVFELVQVRKSGSRLDVTFEDAVVADLRRARGLLSAKAGTTTVDAFARRLLIGAPGARLVAFTGQRNLAPLARGSEDDRDEDSWTALQRLASERGWRCFADRGTVYLGPDSWLLGRARPLDVREHTGGVDDVDWDADSGKKATRGTVTATIARWSAPPGTPVRLLDQGLGSGVWLVSDVRRPLFRELGEIELVRQQPALPEPKPEPRDDGQPSSLPAASSGGAAAAGPVSARGFSWPLTGPLTSSYGTRGGRLHAGQDIACPIGTSVKACKDGTVLFAGTAGGYGTAVYVEHDGGVVTRYAHLSRLSVRRGQQVDRGQVLGLSGNTGRSTGPHLHLELRVGGRPVDPIPYLPARR